MTSLWQFVALLAIHWFADFFLQSHWMATNKSKRLDALGLHIGTYTGVLFVAAIPIFWANSLLAVSLFAGANGVLHFVTDYVTSRITSRLFQQQRWHDFFVMVGVDQLIHQVTLAATMWLLL